MTMKGFKLDEGKARMDLLPLVALHQVAQVMTVSAEPVGKYPARNWEAGMRWGKLWAAAHRHLWAFWLGQENDPETGLPHLAHAACCILFLCQLSILKPGDDDDRPYKEYNIQP